MAEKILLPTAFDDQTWKWFQAHPGAETTVMRCEKCGLFFKPILGHKCKKEGGDGK